MLKRISYDTSSTCLVYGHWKISFQKYLKLCELEAYHVVDTLETRSLTHFIAESQHWHLRKKPTQAKFISLLIHGLTDKGNADIKDVFMVVWCHSSSADEKMHTRTTNFHIRRPKTVDAQGLFLSLKSTLMRLGISDVDAEKCKRLIEIGRYVVLTNTARWSLRMHSRVTVVCLFVCLSVTTLAARVFNATVQT